MFKKGIIYVLCTVICISILQGCSSSSESKSSQSADYATEEAGSYGSPTLENTSSHGETKIVSYNNSPTEKEKMEARSDNSTSFELDQRKIIREQYIEQQVQDLKLVITDLERSVNSTTGAFIESLEEWKREGRERTEHRAQIILRIPVEHFPYFLDAVEKQGNIVNRRLSGQDVTEEFVDNASSLRNLQAHEDRILKLYEKANTIEEMLKIENELSRIRSSIEQLAGRQKYLGHVTSTVKLALELFQVEEADFVMTKDETSLFTEAWIGFKRSLKQLGQFGKKSLIILISLLPYLLIIVLPVGLLFYFILRRTKSAFPKSSSVKEKEHEAEIEKNLDKDQEDGK
jgi:hypothetical protein